ncbi:MAG: hypothetical protein AAFY71_25905 [Bacteroidota bacterium]
MKHTLLVLIASFGFIFSINAQAQFIRNFDIQLSIGILNDSWGSWKDFRDKNDMVYEGTSSRNPLRFALNYKVNDRWDVSFIGLGDYQEVLENNYIDPNVEFSELTEASTGNLMTYKRTWGRITGNQRHFSLMGGYKVLNSSRFKVKTALGAGYTSLRYFTKTFEVYDSQGREIGVVNNSENITYRSAFPHARAVLEASYCILPFLHATIGSEYVLGVPNTDIQSFGFAQLYAGISLGMNGGAKKKEKEQENKDNASDEK